jgi:hypothetical protein
MLNFLGQKENANQNNTEISPHSNQNGHGQEYKQQMLARMEGKRNLIYCHFWWEYKLVQPLWKAVWRFLTKLKLELSYNPLIPFLGIYLKEGKSGYNEDTCTPMFISAMFTIAKIWKQPRCPTTDECINKHTMVYYSAIKKKGKWMKLDINILREIRQTEKATITCFSPICRI